jgi:6-phosphofructokinase
MPTQRIGVLTSGGDCPGLNAVLRGVTKAAENLRWQVIGFQDGFVGLLPPTRYIVLDRINTAGIMQQGGTILGTTNRGHFIAKIGAGEKARVPREIIDRTRQTVRELEINGLIVIGGDGSLSTALQLHEAGIPIIGVPKTIDNDLEATSMTFGFYSAVSWVTEALDRLHPTALSHKRVMVLEVMGRHAGWIALFGGIAGCADVILIPEIFFEWNHVADAVRRRDAEGYQSTMIVIAEGAKPKDGEQHFQQTAIGEHRRDRSRRGHATYRKRIALLRSWPSSKRRTAHSRGPAARHPFWCQGCAAHPGAQVRRDGKLSELRSS